MQGLPLPLVVLAKVDAEDTACELFLHGHPSGCGLSGSLADIGGAIGVADDVNIRKDDEAFFEHLFDEGAETP